jgi:hypothetical protein
MQTTQVRFGQVFEFRGPQQHRDVLKFMPALFNHQVESGQNPMVMPVVNLPGKKFIHTPHGSPARSFVVGGDADVRTVHRHLTEILNARAKGKLQQANRWVKRLTRFLRIEARKAPDISSISK